MHDGTPCVVLSGIGRDRAGYGKCNAKRHGTVVWRRHRLAWIDHHGCLPPEDRPFILHHCDNPPCENPAHLYAGTARNNTRDMVSRGRNRSRQPDNRGERHGLSRLTDDQARAIKYTSAGSARQVATLYCVSVDTVRNIRNGRRWKHI